jgi:hypothetical protein
MLHRLRFAFKNFGYPDDVIRGEHVASAVADSLKPRVVLPFLFNEHFAQIFPASLQKHVVQCPPNNVREHVCKLKSHMAF